MKLISEVLSKLKDNSDLYPLYEGNMQELEKHNIRNQSVALKYDPSPLFFLSLTALISLGNQVTIFSNKVSKANLAKLHTQVILNSNKSTIQIIKNEFSDTNKSSSKAAYFITDFITGNILSAFTMENLEYNINYIKRRFIKTDQNHISISSHMEISDQFTILLFAILEHIPFKFDISVNFDSIDSTHVFLPYFEYSEHLQFKQVFITEFIEANTELEDKHHNVVMLYRIGTTGTQYADYNSNNFNEISFRPILLNNGESDYQYYETYVENGITNHLMPGQARVNDIFVKSNNQYKPVCRNTDFFIYNNFFIDLIRLDNIFISHPNIDQASVYLSREHINILFVFYTLSNNIQSEDELYQYFENKLEGFEINLTKLTKLPFTMFGGVERNKLNEYINFINTKSSGDDKLKIDISKAISDFLYEINSKVDSYTVDLSLSYEELWLNSLSFIDMILSLEEKFDFSYPDQMLDIALFKNLNEFIDYTCGYIRGK